MIALLVILLIYQIFVSARLIKSRFYTKEQVRNQLLLIWFIPVAGSVICHLMLRTLTQPAKRLTSIFQNNGYFFDSSYIAGGSAFAWDGGGTGFSAGFDGFGGGDSGGGGAGGDY